MWQGRQWLVGLVVILTGKFFTQRIHMNLSEAFQTAKTAASKIYQEIKNNKALQWLFGIMLVTLVIAILV